MCAERRKDVELSKAAAAGMARATAGRARAWGGNKPEIDDAKTVIDEALSDLETEVPKRKNARNKKAPQQ